VGERYNQVWAPDNGHVPFPSIITIWGGDTFSHKLEVGERRSLASHYTLTTAYTYKLRPKIFSPPWGTSAANAPPGYTDDCEQPVPLNALQQAVDQGRFELQATLPRSQRTVWRSHDVIMPSTKQWYFSYKNHFSFSFS